MWDHVLQTPVSETKKKKRKEGKKRKEKKREKKRRKKKKKKAATTTTTSRRRRSRSRTTATKNRRSYMLRVHYETVKTAHVSCRRFRWFSCWLLSLIHDPFRPYGSEGPSEPDLKRIACRHGRTVETAQSMGFNQSVRSKYSVLYSKIPNGWNASASQWAPAVWAEARERPEVTRGGNSRAAARLNTSTFPLL